MEQWDSRLLTCVWCVLKEYLHVCYFLSLVDEAYCTAMLTFMNRMAHFVLHNSYCISLPMKWHAGRFLCSTVNMLCGSLNRLLAVWQPEQTVGCVTVYRNTAVLLTCCVAAWTDCWLCGSVQKYCCTVTGGGFVNWTKSNCSCISSPPTPAYHCHCHRHYHHHHHYHIFSWFTNCIAERQNMYKAHTILYILYILQYIYRYISLSSS